jgi:DNA-binding HxlR family transcriptional regulator
MDWHTINAGLDSVGDHVTPRQLQALKTMGREIAYGGEERLAMVQRILGLLGDRWGALILLVLATGTLRHAGLRRTLHAISPERLISQRMLTLKLRDFERHDLVKRRLVPEARPIVDYTLTHKGQELAQQVRALIDWIDKYPLSK